MVRRLKITVTAASAAETNGRNFVKESDRTTSTLCAITDAVRSVPG
jgi:hypothetical protein